MGYFIGGVFAAIWVISTLVYRWRGYERLPVATGPPGGLGGEG